MNNNATVTTAVVVVNQFTQGKPDVNGLYPVILSPISGRVPNLGSVLSGTVAQNSGFEVGYRYLVTFTPREIDLKYGQRFQTLNCGVVNTIEALQSVKELGAGVTYQIKETTPVVTNDVKVPAEVDESGN